MSPSIAAQWDAGAVRTICEYLNISTFWIVPLTDSYEKWFDIETLKSNPSFRNATDFDTWARHLPPATCTSFSDLLAIDSGTLRSEWKRPEHNLTILTCGEIIDRYARKLIEEEFRKRNELQEAFQLEKGARQELDAANLRYNLLLQQLRLEDNTEGREVIQRFHNLNSLIDEFSVDLSQTTPKDLLERLPNTSSCYNRIKSEQHLGSSETDGMLCKLSHAGDSMATDMFLGILLGSIICQDLHYRIFQPFYPQDGSQVEMPDFSIAYNRIRQECTLMTL